MKLSLKSKLKILFIHTNYLVAISMIFIAVFIISNYDFFELRSAYYLKSESETTKGVITKKWVANDQYDFKMAYDFSFRLDDFGEFTGTSYSKFDKFSKGDTIYIDYVPWGPSYSKIQRFELIEKSTATLWISGFLCLFSLILFLYSFFDRLSLIKELKHGQIIKIEFDFVSSPDWFIKKIYSPEDGWELNDFFRKYTFSYQLAGEKRQVFSLVRFSREKYKSKNQFGLTRKNKRPRLLVLLPKTILNSFLKQSGHEN
ncbi:hypothetical protein [Roseivirga sp. E12]|uniref:hypothetical protein n=1 Tax=Roseivirga sp. E12 TaxID=2819237 RepID=UPI001ABCA8DD|nr:hypothetical protein [Roseivirga sp. E12]MBO3699602.1 hypothetical protein [Roseivirga sp. E12]